MYISTTPKSQNNEISFLFWDNDALTDVFLHQELLDKYVTLFPNAKFFLPPPVKAEFLKSNNGIKLILQKEKFINDNEEFFHYVSVSIESQATLNNNIENFSCMYSSLKLGSIPSYSDLYLQGLSLLVGNSVAIITRNRKDFNTEMFYTEMLMEYHLKEGQKVYMLSPNSDGIERVRLEYSEKKNSIT